MKALTSSNDSAMKRKTYLGTGPAGQRGFSSLCFFSTILVLLAATFFAVKIFPVYMSDRSIQNALTELSETPGAYRFQEDLLLRELQRAAVRTARLKSDLKDMRKIGYVRAKNGEKIVGVNYEVVVPVLGNVSILLRFEHEETMQVVTGRQ